MTTTQSSLVKSNRAFMALEDMGAKLRFVSVDTGRVHGPQGRNGVSTWPRRTDDGRGLIWACCVSPIGPKCGHRA